MPSDGTSVVSAPAAVGSLTGSRHRVPQGPDSRVLDPKRRAHQQQHRLPGALHPAPTSGSTSFTLVPQGRHGKRHKLRFYFDGFFFSPTSCMCSSHRVTPPGLLLMVFRAALIGVVGIIAQRHFLVRHLHKYLTLSFLLCMSRYSSQSRMHTLMACSSLKRWNSLLLH